MIKSTLTAAAFAVLTAALPGAALAETPNKVAFQYGGESYTYSVTTAGNIRTIRGEIASTHKPFVLRVSDTHVSGDVDGQPVSFTVASVAPLKGTPIAER